MNYKKPKRTSYMMTTNSLVKLSMKRYNNILIIMQKILMKKKNLEPNGKRLRKNHSVLSE